MKARDDQGLATTEVVLLVPALLFLIMVVIQFGLWYHAQHVVLAAAQEGVRAARVEAGSAADGQVRAEVVLATLAQALVEEKRVTSVRESDVAIVEVRGRVTAVVPGLSLPVSARAESPLERFRSTSS